MTQIPRKTIAQVWERAHDQCERCHTDLQRGSGMYSIHHRLPRRMGGTKDPNINHINNLVLLCGSGTNCCHGWIESHRKQAHEQGWLLHSWDDPTSEFVKKDRT